MVTKLNLEVEANKLAQASEGVAKLDTKFGLEYIISNIDEDILIDNGFKYVGLSDYSNCPIYQKENIYGLFLGNSFRLGEGLLTTEESLNEENENEGE